MKISENNLNILVQNKWQIVNEKLHKEFIFNSYEEVMMFTNSIFKVAQFKNHHPDLTVLYSKVIVEIVSYDAKCITNRCFQLAQAIDILI